MSLKEKLEDVKENIQALWAFTFSPMPARDIANSELMKRGSMERVGEPEMMTINPGDLNCKHQLTRANLPVRKFGEYTAEFTEVYSCSLCGYQYSSKTRSLY